MKIIVTGSLGNISKPLTEELVQKGAYSNRNYQQNPKNKKDIESLGAKAAVGTVEDVHFLTSVFTGADAVYCMLPPGGIFSDPNFDVMAHADKVANNYVKAIEQAGVKRVVYLSSIGAHTNKGNGILAFHYNAEKILQKLPADVAITFMRPVGFYYNLFGFINSIKTQNLMASNYGAEDMVPWVSPIDIAASVANEITALFTGRNIRYIASEEITCNDIAGILGAAIGKA